jgi:uncharacterized phage-associated protein
MERFLFSHSFAMFHALEAREGAPMESYMLAPLVGFDSKKAAQIAAFFVAKQPEIEKLKLIKLVYLAERLSLSEFGQPMLYDEFYSLKDGPICSSTLNGINGEIGDFTPLMQVDANRRNVHLLQSLSRDEMDEVSDAELEILEATWNEFGRFSASEIRNWTHENCPEYTEVTSGRVPISYADILNALGDERAKDIDEEVTAIRRFAGLVSA